MPEVPCYFINGTVESDVRHRIVERFRGLDGPGVLLSSMRVGGQGLTLTEANNVVFINRWWNPAVNAQARDRVIRIGQQREVNVHSFVCVGTIEESLDHILAGKERIFGELLDRLVEAGFEGYPEIARDAVAHAAAALA